MSEHKSFLLHLNILAFDKPRLAHQLSTEFSSIKDAITYLKSQESDAQWRKRLDRFDEAAYLKRLHQQNIKLLFISDDDYPESLRQIADPPIVLHYKGNKNLLKHPMMAIVGPRKMSHYAQQVTPHIVKGLVGHFHILSGLAQGVDALAHYHALKANHPTIGVIGTGIDNVFPKSNQPLYDKMEKEGLILSEYPLGTPGYPQHFPQRNRIVSGLSQGVVVIEAGEKSGSLITAKYATEQNKEIFAIPGSILSDHSIGVHKLIQDGAKCVHSPQDILNEYQYLFPEVMAPKKSKEAPKQASSSTVDRIVLKYPEFKGAEIQLLKALEETPLILEDLVEKTELPVTTILQFLTLFEMKEIVELQPGNKYALMP